MSTFEQEVRSGKRFQFGKNWRSFLSTLTEERKEIAENSIKEMLGLDSLKGKKVIDIGSGSGLFSLAARRLGAEVHSFDFDTASVACTQELRSRYYNDDPGWVIEEASILDKEFINTLDCYDIVYSWGVLHHTGDMWSALENAGSLVKRDGMLYIAIYNDQGRKSRIWKKIKKTYCSGIIGRITTSCICLPYFFMRDLKYSLIKRVNILVEYKKKRGMSLIHDWFDWLGGYPFEVASPEEIFDFFKSKGFVLHSLKTCGGSGCNQFVFVKEK